MKGRQGGAINRTSFLLLYACRSAVNGTTWLFVNVYLSYSNFIASDTHVGSGAGRNPFASNPLSVRVLRITPYSVLCSAAQPQRREQKGKGNVDTSCMQSETGPLGKSSTPAAPLTLCGCVLCLPPHWPKPPFEEGRRAFFPPRFLHLETAWALVPSGSLRWFVRYLTYIVSYLVKLRIWKDSQLSHCGIADGLAGWAVEGAMCAGRRLTGRSRRFPPLLTLTLSLLFSCFSLSKIHLSPCIISSLFFFLLLFASSRSFSLLAFRVFYVEDSRLCRDKAKRSQTAASVVSFPQSDVHTALSPVAFRTLQRQPCNSSDSRCSVSSRLASAPSSPRPQTQRLPRQHYRRP